MGAGRRQLAFNRSAEIIFHATAISSASAVLLVAGGQGHGQANNDHEKYKDTRDNGQNDGPLTIGEHPPSLLVGLYGAVVLVQTIEVVVGIVKVLVVRDHPRRGGAGPRVLALGVARRILVIVEAVILIVVVFLVIVMATAPTMSGASVTTSGCILGEEIVHKFLVVLLPRGTSCGFRHIVPERIFLVFFLLTGVLGKGRRIVQCGGASPIVIILAGILVRTILAVHPAQLPPPRHVFDQAITKGLIVCVVVLVLVLVLILPIVRYGEQSRPVVLLHVGPMGRPGKLLGLSAGGVAGIGRDGRDGRLVVARGSPAATIAAPAGRLPPGRSAVFERRRCGGSDVLDVIVGGIVVLINNVVCMRLMTAAAASATSIGFEALGHGIRREGIVVLGAIEAVVIRIIPAAAAVQVDVRHRRIAVRRPGPPPCRLGVRRGEGREWVFFVLMTIIIIATAAPTATNGNVVVEPIVLVGVAVLAAVGCHGLVDYGK
mmetsp:Transcript_23501/g.67733  ORF Transcript_23501/g.67733 Transcript_23501/m.67733 type:complete len:488 (+) Transcript_23501:1440-2903(+)